MKDCALIKASTGFGIYDIFDIGLVMDKNKNYAKTAIDFIAAIVTLAMISFVLLIECKTRFARSAEAKAH